MIPPDIINSGLALCANATVPQLYGCPVPATQILDGYSMLILHDYGDFEKVYLVKCLVGFFGTWIVVHYLVKWYETYLRVQAEEKLQNRRITELPGVYETQNEKNK